MGLKYSLEEIYYCDMQVKGMKSDNIEIRSVVYYRGTLY